MKLINFKFNIKYVCFLITHSYLFFIDYIYIRITNKQIIDIDNEFKENLFEKDMKFSHYQTKLKPIAFYYPEYNNISYFKYSNKTLKNDNYYINKIKRLVNAQIKLALEHQIYGFAIFFNLFNSSYFNRIFTNIILNKLKFPFFLIWRNEEINTFDIRIINMLINNISKYMISDNYIKFNDKPILSLNAPYKLKEKINIILTIRKLANDKIGKIFLLYPYKGNYTEQKFLNQFDAIYDSSKLDIFKDTTKKTNIRYFSGFIYKNLLLNKLLINYKLFRTCYINYYYYLDYKPEKFYIQNNIIFQSEIDKYIYNEGFIFIDSWNDYLHGNYLEFDENYGYSAINSFSKALLNISYQVNKNFKLNDDNQKVKVAIHIHVFYEELFVKILDRINLIPVKYDLFISTISKEKKIYIENCLMNSNHNNYEIKIFENKGRDIYPFLTQIRRHFKYYKYICHLHTKKSIHNKLLGSNWSEYLYNNLIGSKEIISNIIYDFENNKRLGIIFPEAYYEIIKGVHDFDNTNFPLNSPNKNYMNFILKRIFHIYNIGDKLIFPVGNMFWARVKAIYQIFNVRIRYPKELNQINKTVMHAIERIWLYLVKLNGYEYKMIFKHY